MRFHLIATTGLTISGTELAAIKGCEGDLRVASFAHPVANAYPNAASPRSPDPWSLVDDAQRCRRPLCQGPKAVKAVKPKPNVSPVQFMDLGMQPSPTRGRSVMQRVVGGVVPVGFV